MTAETLGLPTSRPNRSNDTDAFFERALQPYALVAIAALWLLVSITAEYQWSRATALEILVADWLGGLAWVVGGLLIWLRRPGTSFGPLMVVVSFIWFAGGFLTTGNGWIAIYSQLFSNASFVFILILVLAYPAGRIHSRIERWTVWLLAADVIIFPLLDVLTMPTAYGWPVCNLCDTRVNVHDPLASLSDNRLGNLVYNVGEIVVPFLVLLVGILLVRRFAQATPAGRRVLTPILIASAFTIAWLLFHRGESGDLVTGALFGNNLSRSEMLFVFWAEKLAFAAIPVGFVVGLLQIGPLGGSVGQLMEQLDFASEAGSLEALVSRALGDPTARIFRWDAKSGALTNSTGEDVDAAGVLDARAQISLEHRGESLGVLVHDVALLAQPELVRSVAAAASLELANENLRSAVQAQLAEVESSRARIVQAADSERRRVERIPSRWRPAEARCPAPGAASQRGSGARSR
ncbi:MAG TPA: hypothetical protein VFY10_10270 [Dehalococcoidia bacterium]|nr:hypothetical protein [Dehalococcoidia bacterium]